MKRNTFLCIFWATQYLFSCWNQRDHIFLPFLFSIASNGTCGFSMFSSSVKEALQMQCQTNLDQWNEHNSWKLHWTHYFFFFCPVWAQIFWWTQRNTFWISLLKAGNLASSEVGGNLIISNQQKYIWRKPGQKVTLQSKSERSLIACVQQKWIWEHTFLLEFVWKKLHGLEVRSLEPWDIDSGEHAYNLRNRSVLCRNDLCLPASSILKH